MPQTTPDQNIEGLFSVVYDASSSASAQTVKAGASGDQIFILNVSISTDTAQSVKLVEDGGGAIIARKFLPANSVWSKSFSDSPRAVSNGSGVKIICGGASGNVTVDLDGYVK